MEAVPAVVARDVAVTFTGRRDRRPVRAVDGVDLTIPQGEVIALVGESGCGKTTLARALLGLVPAAGSVSIDGLQVGGGRATMREVRRHAQLVFQDPTGSMNPRHSVYEIVAEGLRVQGGVTDERERVSAALEQCGLRPAERFFLRFPHELSGGQRQRVIIAGAIVLEPSLLIADEPVSSLDASVRGEILALLASLSRIRTMTVLVVTHDLGLAWNIADRVAVMYLGRIVELGPTEAVLGQPKHPYTRALLSVVPEQIRSTSTILPGETPDPAAIPGGCRFHPRCPAVHDGQAEQAGVVERCRTADLRLGAEVSRTDHVAACHLISATG